MIKEIRLKQMEWQRQEDSQQGKWQTDKFFIGFTVWLNFIICIRIRSHRMYLCVCNKKPQQTYFIPRRIKRERGEWIFVFRSYSLFRLSSSLCALLVTYNTPFKPSERTPRYTYVQ